MSNLLRLNLMLLVLFSVQACSVNDDSKQTSKPQLSKNEQANALKTQKACEAESGTWKKVGRIQIEACVLPTSDAGNTCNDRSQCEVACITKDNVKPGTKIEGQCYGSTNLFGCRTHITNGVAEPTLCID